MGAIYRNGKIITATTQVKAELANNDLNAFMAGGFYDQFTDSFIDQIMTGKYIKK